ncbi:putative glycosyltransferase CsbB [compost metagenome]
MFGLINLQGWTTIIALITFLLGIIMIMLGIIGEYLWRILDESRSRPAYIVDEIYE